MTETQKESCRTKIFDFPCISQKKVVSLHAVCVHNENNKESGKPIAAPLVQKLSWSHFVISTDDDRE
jgi:hypothetical protein